jgi:hypothetical protein
VARAIAFGLDEQERFTFLMERLLERGVVANPPASLLAERLRRALAARPRLAFSADEVFLVEEWIVQAQPDVVASVPALTAALLDQLHRNMAGSPASR